MLPVNTTLEELRKRKPYHRKRQTRKEVIQNEIITEGDRA